MSTQTVSVNLPENTLYVSGTVNDVAVTWTNTEGNTWETVAEKAENDTYVVALTIIDGNGNTSTDSVVLYYGLLNLITDRTASDVERWRELRDRGFADLTEAEKSEWMSGMKGAYKHTDWNRVESAVEYVAKRLTELGYMFAPVVKKNWSETDIPSKDDWIRYYYNVQKIREFIAIYNTAPIAPTIDNRLNFEIANNIEQILKDADVLAGLIEISWCYSNEILAGEV